MRVLVLLLPTRRPWPARRSGSGRRWLRRAGRSAGFGFGGGARRRCLLETPAFRRVGVLWLWLWLCPCRAVPCRAVPCLWSSVAEGPRRRCLVSTGVSRGVGLSETGASRVWGWARRRCLGETPRGRRDAAGNGGVSSVRGCFALTGVSRGSEEVLTGASRGVGLGETGASRGVGPGETGVSRVWGWGRRRCLGETPRGRRDAAGNGGVSSVRGCFALTGVSRGCEDVHTPASRVDGGVSRTLGCADAGVSGRRGCLAWGGRDHRADGRLGVGWHRASSPCRCAPRGHDTPAAHRRVVGIRRSACAGPTGCDRSAEVSGES